MEKNKNMFIIIAVIVIVWLLIAASIMGNFIESLLAETENETVDDTFKIIASTENKDIENILVEYAKKNQIKLQMF